MIIVMVHDEGERQDVLSAFRAELGGQVPFQILLDGRIADDYPSGWAGARTRGDGTWARAAT